MGRCFGGYAFRISYFCFSGLLHWGGSLSALFQFELSPSCLFDRGLERIYFWSLPALVLYPEEMDDFWFVSHWSISPSCSFCRCFHRSNDLAHALHPRMYRLGLSGELMIFLFGFSSPLSPLSQMFSAAEKDRRFRVLHLSPFLSPVMFAKFWEHVVQSTSCRIYVPYLFFLYFLFGVHVLRPELLLLGSFRNLPR